MKSKALIETERNIKRMHLDLSDAEFEQMLVRQERMEKRVIAGIIAGAIFTAAVVAYDPLAQTLHIGLEFAIKMLDNLG